jgi:hypothetical protein
VETFGDTFEVFDAGKAYVIGTVAIIVPTGECGECGFVRGTGAVAATIECITMVQIIQFKAQGGYAIVRRATKGKPFGIKGF